MEEADPPELHRVDLASTALLLKDYGVTDVSAFEWFEAPPAGAIERAIKLLGMLGAVDDSGALTERGRLLARLPIHPRLGLLLAEGAGGGYTREAALLAALLSERDIVPQGFQPPATECDLLTRLDLMREDSSRLDRGAVRAVQRVAGDLERLASRMKKARATTRTMGDVLRRALLAAYPDRVVTARSDDQRRGVMVGGRGVRLEPESGVRDGKLFLALELRDPPGGGGEARVRIASCIDASWLTELHPRHVSRGMIHRVDGETGRVSSRIQSRYFDLTFSEAPASPNDDPEGVAAALVDFLESGMEDFLLGEKKTASWLQRVRFLSEALPDEGWPCYTRDELREVFMDASVGCRSVREVGDNIMQALRGHLGWKLAEELDALAPETITVPSGTHIRLKYAEPGADAPILAARLQELFGMEDTPRLARGKVAVLLHLLGPNYRPVQVTRDLRSFWNTTYQEVRKELRARYPKHPWPEDPWKADAVAVGRRRR